MSISSPMRSCIKFLLPLLLLVTAYDPLRGAREVSLPLPEKKTAVLAVWQGQFQPALALAAQENKPVLVYFYTPGSNWCAAFKTDVLSASRIQPLLEKFILVELDPVNDVATAGKFRVLGTPAVRFLTSTGAAISSLDGAVTLERFEAALRVALNPEAEFTGANQDVEALFALIAKGKVPPHVWPALMMAMGDAKQRDAVRSRIVALQPFPKLELVALLEDPRLTVRLGAMELLEDAADDSFRFNPWNDGDDEERGQALASWKTWAQGKGTVVAGPGKAKLTEQEIGACVRDLIADDQERSARALRKLSENGKESRAVLLRVHESNRELSERARRKIKEAVYLLTLQGSGGLDAPRVAHQLVFGNLDNRLQAIADTAKAGVVGVPILTDFLADREAIVRETALDALFVAHSPTAVTCLTKLLPQEKDTNVLLSASRGLGTVGSPQSLTLLRAMLADSREEVVSAALRALGEMKATSAEPDVRRMLEDDRWRVRVTALEVAMAIPLPGLSTEIVRHVSDPDEFVRISAITAIGKLGGKQYASTLDQAFFKDDALKAAVIEAYEAIDTPVPATYVKALENKAPAVLLSVLSSLKSVKGATALIPIYLSRHKDLDVSCTAIRVMGRHGMEQAKCVESLVAVLRDGPDEKRLAVFDRLDVNDIKESLRSVRDSGAPVASQSQNKSQSVVNSFMEAMSSDSAAVGGNINDAFAREVVRCMRSTASPLLSRQAALSLLKAGNPIGLTAMGDVSTLPLEMRLSMAEALDDMDEATALAVFPKLIQDSSDEIRSNATKSFLSRSRIPFKLALEALGKPDGIAITESMIYSFCHNMESQTEFRNQAIASLKSITNPKLQTLILCGLTKVSPAGATVALDFVKSSDPYQRRAAWYAFGRMAPDELTGRANEIMNDSSPYVREVLPALIARPNYQWLRSIDKDVSSQMYDYGRGNAAVTLSADLAGMLQKMTADRDPHVRTAAFYALLCSNYNVDVAQMTEAVQNEPNKEWISSALSTYFERNINTVPATYEPLMALAKERHSESEFRRIRARWKTDASAVPGGAASVQPGETTASKKPVATATSSNVPASAPETTSPPVKLIFFESPGCNECLKIKKAIARIRESIPGLDVETHNIRTTDAMRLNETLSQHFGVPANLRLIAPAVFAGGGFLVKGDITDERLGNLVAASAEIPLEKWYHFAPKQLAEADKAITRRYEQFSAGLILLAGLLDGINPCAFATIIFFLSYLQVARRSRTEIAQVGLAFVLAVFLTYFVLGLGLVEVVGRLILFKWLSLAFNVVLALFSLLVAVLSFRDGLLCLRGQITDMTLQLPEFLKARIHTVIRANVRHSRFVLAAFVTGIVVSLLELACTGQVYAPTILFMLKTDSGKGGAVGYLLLYNVAFILPLLAIFALAYFGMRSEALGKVLSRHAAWIKFATAGLFFVLFLIIAISHFLR